MRQLLDIELRRIQVLTENSVEFTLIEPTKTGLEKSIMDATGPVRIYLKDKGVHDYITQKQGQENKILIRSRFINQDDVPLTMASLYRPETKNGDPRIWFKGLNQYAIPNDILCIISCFDELFVLNITRIDIEKLITSEVTNPLKELVNYIKNASNAIANELLLLLRKIAARGPIKALLQADTAIGRTLETLLGININSSKKPDYKGIELKSYRDKKGNRKTLFAQVSNWELSKFKSSEEILNAFGYKRESDFKLYCTVSAIVRNSQGLKFKIDNSKNQLIENSDKISIGDFVVWTLDNLHKRLIEKHNETFWIGAESKIINGEEHFLYNKVLHTRKPIVSQFDILLEQGIITMDHLIKRKLDGSVSEKGPLFKIKPNATSLLFPPSNTYNLLQ